MCCMHRFYLNARFSTTLLLPMYVPVVLAQAHQICFQTDPAIAVHCSSTSCLFTPSSCCASLKHIRSTYTPHLLCIAQTQLKEGKEVLTAQLADASAQLKAAAAMKVSLPFHLRQFLDAPSLLTCLAVYLCPCDGSVNVYLELQWIASVVKLWLWKLLHYNLRIALVLVSAPYLSYPFLISQGHKYSYNKTCATIKLITCFIKLCTPTNMLCRSLMPSKSRSFSRPKSRLQRSVPV